MAGAFLAIGSFVSTLTKNQVIAFIVASLICFLFIDERSRSGSKCLRAWTPEVFATAVSSMSFLSHFERITQRRARPADARLLLLDDCLLAVRDGYRDRSEESAVRLAMSDLFASIKRAFRPLVARCATVKRSTLAWTGLALAGLVLLSVNLTSSIGLKTWRADLTQDRLFTISKGTREILNSIDEPISARLYFSRNLAAASPDVARYFDRVRTLFEQYRDISGGKLQLSILDPEPFSDAEDKEQDQPNQ